MVMGINEAWSNDVSASVDDLLARDFSFGDPCDLPVLHADIPYGVEVCLGVHHQAIYNGDVAIPGKSRWRVYYA